MSIDHSTYTQLGLIGHKQKMPRGCKSVEKLHGKKYIVVVVLTSLQRSSDFSDRVFTCLGRFGVIDMLVCAVNAHGNEQTISIDTEAIGDDEDFLRKRLEINGDLHSFADAHLPPINNQVPSDGSSWERQRQNIQQVHEWLGIAACRMEGLLQKRMHRDEYLSTYSPFDDATADDRQEGPAVSIRWRGLITNHFCKKAVMHAKEQVAQKRVPWAAVMVWGFPDTPASWWQKGIRREHGFILEGCNGYTLVCLPNDAYWLIQSIGANDRTV